jgi:hypothetical protein
MFWHENRRLAFFVNICCVKPLSVTPVACNKASKAPGFRQQTGGLMRGTTLRTTQPAELKLSSLSYPHLAT